MFRKIETYDLTLKFSPQVKKLFAIAFTCVYLLLSVGVVKTTHYCMGRESSSSLFTAAQECPCSLFSIEKDSCCDDDSTLIRLGSDQQTALSITINSPDFFILEPIFINSLFSIQTSNRISDYTSFDDPITIRQSLFKLHCSYLFYDGQV